MPKFGSLEAWIGQNWGSQREFARKMGVAQNTVSQWMNGKSRIKGEMEKKIRALGYDGPLPHEGNIGETVSELSTPYVRDYNPGEYAAEAYAIVAEAARAGGAQLEQLDQDLVRAAIAATADAVAQGRGDEIRQLLVRRAETLLQVHRK